MKALPANRVILILGVIVTVAGVAATYVAGVTNSLPASWQGNAAIIVTVLGGIAGVITAVVKFLDGSQKFDALQAQARAQPASPPAMTASARAREYDLPLRHKPEPAPEPEQTRTPADINWSPRTGWATPPEAEPAPEPTDVDQDRVDDGHWRPVSALEPAEIPAAADGEAKAA